MTLPTMSYWTPRDAGPVACIDQCGKMFIRRSHAHVYADDCPNAAAREQRKAERKAAKRQWSGKKRNGGRR